MSNQGKKKVTCPHCQCVFDAIFWTVVRGDLNFKLKEMIMNGEFDLLMCPECGKIFSYEDTFVYTDPHHEIMAFVLPSNQQHSDQLIEKMKADYDLVKNSIQRESLIFFKPYYFLGVDELASFLLNDKDMQEETEVMEFLAKDAGYRLVSIKKSVAREKDFLFSMPYEAQNFSVDSAYNACSKIYSINDRLNRLGKIIDFLRTCSKQEVESILKK